MSLPLISSLVPDAVISKDSTNVVTTKHFCFYHIFDIRERIENNNYRDPEIELLLSREFLV
jgi:hypothetical protein